MAAVFVALASTSFIACPASLDDRCSDNACNPFAPGLDGSIEGGPSSDADADVPDAPLPPNCDESADANSEAAKGCIVDTFAVFVDGTSGDDTKNDGSKAKPFKKISTAITAAPKAGKHRVYICGPGPFQEHLKITTALSLFGGFTCGTWTYDASTKTKISPSDKGYVLDIETVSILARFSDLELIAPDVNAVKDGSSSVAIFANASDASFVRVAASAGLAAAGADGALGARGTLVSVSNGTMSFDGNLGSATVGGLAKECTCSSGAEKSQGGLGGSPTAGGGPGLPSDIPAVGQDNGTAGVGSTACNPNGSGHNGAPSPISASAVKITSRGTLTGTGWQPQAGDDASIAGRPGQGGGGGGGVNGSNAGGGGACGGCGGTPGQGGQGGGASIALLSFQSTISITDSTLKAQIAGKGGTGGTGGSGVDGGTGGGGNCTGGNGGKGGTGGSGAGGAGGVSFTILYDGKAPVTDPATDGATQAGTAGDFGVGGNSPDNDGLPGAFGKTQDVATLK